MVKIIISYVFDVYIVNKTSSQQMKKKTQVLTNFVLTYKNFFKMYMKYNFCFRY